MLHISDTGQRCPVDNEGLSKEQLFPDNFAKREILSLTVRCPNSGCGKKMELRHLEVRISDRHLRFLRLFKIMKISNLGKTPTSKITSN